MGDQMDSVMNYDLSYPLWKYIEEKISLDKFKDIVIDYLAQTPKNVMENMFNLVGSHDTIRIKRRLKDHPDRVKLAYLFMFLSAGAPNIYYGDEIGMTGEHDPDNRRCMLWDESEWDLDFYTFTKTLIHLRKTYEAFKTPDYHFINHEILMFNKVSDYEDILTLMNVGDKKTIDTSLIKGTYLNLITNQTEIIRDTMEIESYGFLVLKKEA
jgi:glycosidase